MKTSLLVAFALVACLAGVSASSVWPSGTPGYGAPASGISTQTNTGGSSTTCYASRAVQMPAQLNGGPNGKCDDGTNQGESSRETCSVPTFCPANSEDRLCPPNEERRFDAGGVRAHFRNQPPGFRMVDARTSTYSCVDARGDEPMLGTPGGDLSELMAASLAIARLGNKGQGYTSKATLEDIADAVFNAFANNYASSSRPIYFHTDDASLRKMFIYLNQNEGISPKPTIMPFSAPDSDSQRTKWLNALSTSEFNGCGHVRLQLDATRERFYSVDNSIKSTVEPCNAELTTCIRSSFVASRMIKNFFGYWWGTAADSAARRRVAFSVDGILSGPLLGKAVAVVSNTYASNSHRTSCINHAPLVRPQFGASMVFTYHGDAVATWRRYVVTSSTTGGEAFRKVMMAYNVPTTPTAQLDRFVATWNNITTNQLGATLTFLKPANSLGIFSVPVLVSTSSSVATQGVTQEAGEAAPEVAAPEPLVVDAAVPVEPVVAAATAAIDVAAEAQPVVPVAVVAEP